MSEIKKAYTIKYSVKKQGYKSKTIQGIAFATSQEIAVKITTKKLEDTKQSNVEFKLLSASMIKTDFITSI